jgi:hypothetical protein
LKGKVLSGRLPLRIIKTEIRMKLLEDPDIKRALVEGRISEIE